MTGGLLGSAAAGAAVPLLVHLGSSAAVFSVAAVAASRFLLAGPEGAERVAVGRPADERRLRDLAGRTILLLVALGTLAACGAFIEDAGSSWGALYLRDEVGAGAAAAGLAFVSLQLAMTVGRLTGDRVVDRFGQRRVARLGAAATALGMALALAVPSLATTIVGFALAGLGVATLVPAALHAADEVATLPYGVGLTIVSSSLRVGFLHSPLIVGLVADAASLRQRTGSGRLAR